MPAPDVDQPTVSASDRRHSSTASSNTDVSDAPSPDASHHGETSMSTTTLADRQRPAGTTSAAADAVKWSAWQPPVDVHELPETVADYDDTADEYVDDDAEDERLHTVERQQPDNNASGTEGHHSV